MSGKVRAKAALEAEDVVGWGAQCWILRVSVRMRMIYIKVGPHPASTKPIAVVHEQSKAGEDLML